MDLGFYCSANNMTYEVVLRKKPARTGGKRCAGNGVEWTDRLRLGLVLVPVHRGPMRAVSSAVNKMHCWQWHKESR